jgi:hypothetical protein
MPRAAAARTLVVTCPQAKEPTVFSDLMLDAALAIVLFSAIAIAAVILALAIAI